MVMSKYKNLPIFIDSAPAACTQNNVQISEFSVLENKDKIT